MRSWFVLLCFVFTFLNTPVFGQQKWQSATIYLEGKSLQQLMATGIAFDHGHYHPGESFHGDFTEVELEKIRNAGFKVQKQAYAKLDPRSSPNNCNPNTLSAPEYTLPVNYPYGSMNGFPTLSEMYESLELMEALYPGLITVRQVIGNFYTTEGRRIYYVKISDNPYADEDEPEVLYTALHNAREPPGMTQMLYFKWYLLENNHRNPQLKNLVNGRELYFIPCVNPDGYAYNESSNPTGGGYWRKNRNPNLDDIGTDLNRNYGYGWAFNNDGSSPVGTSDVYRGTGAFSEVETKAVKYFCEQHDISIALNYHSHGDLLIIPWGYLNQPTEDSLLYYSMAHQMTRFNQFKVGTSNETLNYSVNGVSDDWMYGERNAKRKILAFTPEIGYAFWPNRKDILPINQSSQYMNFIAAWNAGSATMTTETGPVSLSGDTAYLELNITRTGLVQDSIHVSIGADKPGIRFIEPKTSILLQAGETYKGKFTYVIEQKISRGDSIQFNIEVNTGLFKEQVISQKIFLGGPNWKEDFEKLTDWFFKGTGWNLTNETYVSAPECITDSPLKPMDPNVLKIQQYSQGIDLTNVRYAYLRFKGKWQMDSENDFAQIKISTTGGEFEPLCGYYTVNGTLSQAFDEPVYCGVQQDWITEYIDISKYSGRIIYLQLYMYSGANLEGNDGIYIDDVEIFTNIATQNLQEELWNDRVYPQPCDGYFTLYTEEANTAEQNKFILTNAAGVSHSIVPQQHDQFLKFNVSDHPTGVYYLSWISKKGSPRQIKILLR